jgi:hypothetical protein
MTKQHAPEQPRLTPSSSAAALRKDCVAARDHHEAEAGAGSDRLQ